MDENNFEMEENMTTDRGLLKIKKAERERKRNEFDLSKGYKKPEEVNADELPEPEKNKDRILEKEEVSKQINKLDPNNNKNLPQNPVIEKDGKRESDDGFEHRTSSEAS